MVKSMAGFPKIRHVSLPFHINETREIGRWNNKPKAEFQLFSKGFFEMVWRNIEIPIYIFIRYN